MMLGEKRVDTFFCSVPRCSLYSFNYVFLCGLHTTEEGRGLGCYVKGKFMQKKKKFESAKRRTVHRVCGFAKKCYGIKEK